MKDKIISFLLVSILLMLLLVIGILGYTVYCEITGEPIIEINFVGDGGYPTIEIKPVTEDTLINEDTFSGVQGGNTTTPEQSQTVQSRHLYNQLDETAKIIYDKLYVNKENLKTGTYTVDFGNAFQSLLEKEGGDNTELKNQYQSAIEALIYENPDIFYLDPQKMFITVKTITKLTGVKYNVYINNGSKINYLADGYNSKQDIENYEAQIEQVKNYIITNLEGKSDYEKIKIVHDYLIDTIEYDTSIQEDNIYDIYGAFVNKKSVCEGYAKAFQYIMNEVGIENTIVIGKATNSKNETENHAWNYVKLDGQWYAVDVTWDDPIIIGGGILTNKAKYEYFLKGSETINKNHTPSGQFTPNGKVFSYPELSIEDYRR